MTRRQALKAGGSLAVASAGLTAAAPLDAASSLSRLPGPVRIGLIADLHHDVMHDGPARLGAFVKEMQRSSPDAIMQLGDFAYPNEANAPVLAQFANAHDQALHVLGNHEIDDGHSFDEVAEAWSMPGRYYTHEIEGLQLIVLDGNERPEDHKSGYPAHVGDEQLAWLSKTLDRLVGPAIVFSHQPLAGPSSVDNANSVMAILRAHRDKVLLTVNGHTHIDASFESATIPTLHINSASYYWVGGQHRHQSYPAEIHEDHEWISYTCPYRDPLFALLTINPQAGTIELSGRASAWVGESPEQVGVQPHGSDLKAEHITPRIKSRGIAK